MRVALLSLTGQPGPVEECHLACGAATVLVGKNDAGKSFLLEGIDAALRDDERWHFSASLEIFVIASRDYELGEHEISSWDEHPEVDEEWLRRAYDAPPAELAPDVVERLVRTGKRDEGVLAVMTTPVEGLPLQVWLCAAPWDRLPFELREILESTWPDAADRARAQPWRPIPVRPHAAIDPDALFEPIRVPRDPQHVGDAVADAVGKLCRGLRLLPFRTADLGDLEPLGLDFDDESLPLWASEGRAEFDDSPRWLLDEREVGTAVHRYAVLAATIVETLVRGVLPGFFTERYELRVRPRAVIDIARGNPVEIAFADKRNGTLFPLHRLASGHLLWVQLALSEGAARVRWYAQVLDEGARRLSQLAGTTDRDTDSGRELIEDLHFAVRQMRDLLSHWDDLAPGMAEGVIDSRYRGFTAEGEPVTARLVAPARQRLYLVDEPEQRLHPALQRRAANWLMELLEEWGAQCVLATHALAFIDMEGDVKVHEVIRGSDSAVVVAVDLDAFTPHAQLAREMGFDRGEMLSRWRALLFVEGAADEAVLMELYGERLEKSRILVTPVHGHRNHAGLLEMQLLLRGTATPIAALLDGVSESEIQRIRRDASYRDQMLNERDERATVAKIVKAEHSAGRQVELLTIGTADIFDLLDEDAIRTVAGHRFPGHGLALEAFERAGGGNARRRKDFYWEQYGISMTTRSMRRIARETRVRGSRIPALEDTIDRVERLALSEET